MEWWRATQPAMPPDPIAALPAGDVTPAFRDAIARAVADLVPADKRFALLAVTTWDEEASQPTSHFAIAYKADDRWTLGGHASLSWGGPVEGDVFLTAAW